MKIIEIELEIRGKTAIELAPIFLPPEGMVVDEEKLREICLRWELTARLIDMCERQRKAAS